MRKINLIFTVPEGQEADYEDVDDEFVVEDFIGIVEGLEIDKNVCSKQGKIIACPVCGGEGVVDSGGQTPDGTWINMTCPFCEGKGRTENE